MHRFTNHDISREQIVLLKTLVENRLVKIIYQRKGDGILRPDYAIFRRLKDKLHGINKNALSKAEVDTCKQLLEEEVYTLPGLKNPLLVERLSDE